MDIKTRRSIFAAVVLLAVFSMGRACSSDNTSTEADSPTPKVSKDAALDFRRHDITADQELVRNSPYASEDWFSGKTGIICENIASTGAVIQNSRNSGVSQDIEQTAVTILIEGTFNDLNAPGEQSAKDMTQASLNKVVKDVYSQEEEGPKIRYWEVFNTCKKALTAMYRSSLTR